MDCKSNHENGDRKVKVFHVNADDDARVLSRIRQNLTSGIFKDYVKRITYNLDTRQEEKIQADEDLCSLEELKLLKIGQPTLDQFGFTSSATERD